MLELIINIIVLVPIILLLIVISLKLSKKSLDRLNSGSYVQVIERFNLSKEVSVSVMRIGKTGCVLVSSNNNSQVIKELNEEEIEKIIKMKSENNNTLDLSKIKGLNLSGINSKLIKDKR